MNADQKIEAALSDVRHAARKLDIERSDRNELRLDYAMDEARRLGVDAEAQRIAGRIVEGWVWQG